MDAVYRRDFTVCMSHTDFSGTVGLTNLFSLMLDVATEHAEILGIGSSLLREKNVFWLTARSSARLFKTARLGENVTMTTRIVNVNGSHSVRAYRLTRGDELIAECDTTFVAVDMRTGRQLDILTLCPHLLPDDNGAAPAHRDIRFEAEKARELGRYTVRSVDIDLGRHMNNAVYPQILLGFYPMKERLAHPVRALEIAYRSPVLEGETLTGWEYPQDGGRALALLRDDAPVCLAWISDEM